MPSLCFSVPSLSILLLATALFVDCTLGFVTHPSSHVVQTHRLPTQCLRNDKYRRSVSLRMVDEDSSSAPGEVEARKRRRKRKSMDNSNVNVEAVSVQESEQDVVPTVELKPRDYNPVQLQVVDIRDAVGDKRPGSTYKKEVDDATKVLKQETTTTTTTTKASFTNMPSQSSSSPSIPATSKSPSSMDESLKQLLEDAKLMQQQEESSVDDYDDDEGSTVKAKIRNVLGTIVTADFFLVCAFLLWFLVGIFCSSVLKDDAVQISFNNNFQPFVQPALGLLMIGSVAGNFFQDEDDDGV